MKLSQLPPESELVLDTETSKLHPDDGGRISVVSFAFRSPETGRVVAQAIPFDQGGGFDIPTPLGPKELTATQQKRLAKWPDWAKNETVPNRPPQDFSKLMELIWNKRFRLRFHNAKFDLVMLYAGLRDGTFGWDFSQRLDWDTQLVQHVWEPQMPTALKATAVRLGLTEAGNEDAEQEALKPWLGPKQGKNADPRYDLVPWSVMEPYAKSDSILTLLLAEHQERQIDPDADSDTYFHIGREFSLCQTLFNMEIRGIGFDTLECNRNAQILRAEMDRLAALIPFKGSTKRPTPPAAVKYFFTDPGRPPFPGKVTDGGRPQVDEEVVARLVEQKVPFAAEYQTHEGVKSALSKWYESWPALCGKDGRLRMVHRQGTVVSGRLAASRVQLHAIPHDRLMPMDSIVPVRKLFRPRDGYLLHEFDVSQAEIRIATAVARCQPMLDGMLRGEDSHSIATRLMFDVDEDHPDWDGFRQVAKRCNLGILYGAGAKTIQDQIAKFTGRIYPLTRVRGWVDDWKEAFPQFDQELDRFARMAERQGFVRLYNGRERWFSDYEPTHKAFNQMIQGSLAEVMKNIMVEVDAQYPGELLLQIHDSILLETPVDRVPERTRQVCELMKDRFEKAFAKPWVPGGPAVAVPFRSDAKTWTQQ